MANIVTEQQIRDMLAYLYRPANEEIKDDEVQPVEEAFIDFVLTMVAQAKADMAGTAAGLSLKVADQGVDTVALTNVPRNGVQTIGFVTGAGKNVLLVGQTDPSENGVWVMQDGPWARHPLYDTPAKLSQLVVGVNSGQHAGRVYVQPQTVAALPAQNWDLMVNLEQAIAAMVVAQSEEISIVYLPVTADEQASLPFAKRAGSEIASVTLVADFDHELDEANWAYDPALSVITILNGANLQLSEGNRLRVKERYFNTGNVSRSIDMQERVDGLYWKYTYEGDWAWRKIAERSGPVDGESSNWMVFKPAATVAAARAAAAGSTPMLFDIANDGRASPGRTFALFNPAYPGQLIELMGTPL